MATKKTPQQPAKEQEAPEAAASAAEETAPVDYEALYNEVKGTAAELAEQKDKYIRLLAEYDNYRKRSQKDRESTYADAKSDTVSALLPVYDNLERALAQPTADEAYKKGVEMTMAQLREILGKLGVEEFGAAGDTFDPTVHSGVMHVEDETLGENVIAEVFQKGFRLGDKIISFAMVKVAN